ncbi:hypothetical protein R69608_05522 [Paraburkholderia nemoris]|uniref:hypothetical protein n=1 Tax=Paraburkholderia nemoris TaxID=2793076 RepID=UPI001912CB9C|nr:hypothetical protein [Paraburkholderia nemoris]MBK5150543.1 hypothetical protein [Burkholderia sp. R-69608]CAE6945972.1 hypothetical protein R69608_05522 [Paraburkholderia nemoris]
MNIVGSGRRSVFWTLLLGPCFLISVLLCVACVPVAAPGHVMVRAKLRPGESAIAFKRDQDNCDSIAHGYSRLYAECMQMRGYEVAIFAPDGKQLDVSQLPYPRQLSTPAMPPNAGQAMSPDSSVSQTPAMPTPLQQPAAPAIQAGPANLDQWLTPEQKTRFEFDFAKTFIKALLKCRNVEKKVSCATKIVFTGEFSDMKEVFCTVPQFRDLVQREVNAAEDKTLPAAALPYVHISDTIKQEAADGLCKKNLLAAPIN